MTPRILMCPPDHYGIEYEINPWMNRQRPADPRQRGADRGSRRTDTDIADAERSSLFG